MMSRYYSPVIATKTSIGTAESSGGTAFLTGGAELLTLCSTGNMKVNPYGGTTSKAVLVGPYVPITVPAKSGQRNVKFKATAAGKTCHILEWI